MAREFLSPNQEAGVLFANALISCGNTEKDTYPGLVDFDLITPLVDRLAQQSSLVKLSRAREFTVEDTRHFLEEQRRRWDSGTEHGDYMLHQGDLLTYYFDHKEGNQQIDDPERFYGDILGMKPDPIPEEELNRRQKMAKNAFDAVGQAYDRDVDYSRDGWGNFLDWGRIDPRELRKLFKEVDLRLSDPMNHALGNDSYADKISIPSYEIRTVSDDAYYLCWASRNRSGYQLKVNAHPRNETKWFIGKPGWGNVHELWGHMGMTNHWMDNIIDGKINPGYGAETCPGVGQPVLESTADTLIDFLPEVIQHQKPEELFAIRLQQLEDMVLWNVALWSNGIVKDHPQDLKVYILDRLPHYTEEMAEKAIRDRTEDIKNATYIVSYGGVYPFLQRAEILQRSQIQTPGGILEPHDQPNWGQKVVRELYQRPMTFPRALAMMDDFVDSKQKYDRWISERRGIRRVTDAVSRAFSGFNVTLMLNSLHGFRNPTEGAA